MKLLLPFLGCLLLVASCSQDREALRTPKARSASSFRTEKSNPHNKKAQRKPGESNIGLGIDMNARNPNKFRTVKRPKNP
ncbi:hypothetical protein LRS06_16910 [Hymenobacter sp. J193]|uniref:hypothetical protein n=1 Tax=Hymenobacter sp. J193 TaxID=2898429 RepID=UPI002151EA0E|nr:hypothetical protein [Hymenobacter sp. J193]MCR5889419.1 hypothetical protein [Hymenobacter sp. J193]